MTTIQRWTLLTAVLGSAIVFLDATVVNAALPRIGRELPATLVGVLEGQTYVTSGYLATLAALLVLAGALADHYGRRRVFSIGLVGFGGASVLCGLAPTLEILVLARVLQGAAGALLVPGAIAIITAVFEGAARARAFGTWASATSATALLGPIVGGTLVDTAGWRLAFLLNVPLVAVALYAAMAHVPETRGEDTNGRFDWLGSIVAVLAVGGLAFGTIRGQDRQWQDAIAFVSLGVGVIALIAFPILMARRPNPLVPLELFRSRAFTSINIATLLIYAALYTLYTFQVLLLQGVLGYTALASSASGLPSGILLTVVSRRVGALVGRFGARRFLTVGPLIMSAGLLWWSRIPSDSPAWVASIGDAASLVPPAAFFVDVLPAVLLFGVGIALVVAPLTSTLIESVPTRNAGLASAINNAVSRVGQPILSALIFVVVTGSFYATLASATGLDPGDPLLRAAVQPLNPPGPGVDPALAAAARVASVDAFHLAALGSAGLLVLGSLTSWIGLRPSRTAADDVASAAAALS